MHSPDGHALQQHTSKPIKPRDKTCALAPYYGVLNPLLQYDKGYYVFSAQAHMHEEFQCHVISCQLGIKGNKFSLVISYHAIHI